jgi:hypothetical protein
MSTKSELLALCDEALAIDGRIERWDAGENEMYPAEADSTREVLRWDVLVDAILPLQPATEAERVGKARVALGYMRSADALESPRRSELVRMVLKDFIDNADVEDLEGLDLHELAAIPFDPVPSTAPGRNRTQWADRAESLRCCLIIADNITAKDRATLLAVFAKMAEDGDREAWSAMLDGFEGHVRGLRGMMELLESAYSRAMIAMAAWSVANEPHGGELEPAA